MLRDVTTVQVVVVLDATFVLVVNLNDKLQELVVIDDLQQVVFLEE